MLSWIERWRRQYVVAAHLLIVNHYVVAHLPDKVVGGLNAEPCLQHVAYAESLVLHAQHAPCALQLKPELHKAFLIILYFHICVCTLGFYNSGR